MEERVPSMYIIKHEDGMSEDGESASLLVGDLQRLWQTHERGIKLASTYQDHTLRTYGLEKTTKDGKISIKFPWGEVMFQNIGEPDQYMGVSVNLPPYQLFFEKKRVELDPAEDVAKVGFEDAIRVTLYDGVSISCVSIPARHNDFRFLVTRGRERNGLGQEIISTENRLRDFLEYFWINGELFRKTRVKQYAKDLETPETLKIAYDIVNQARDMLSLYAQRGNHRNNTP